METKQERNLRLKKMTHTELREQAKKRFPELSWKIDKRAMKQVNRLLYKRPKMKKCRSCKSKSYTDELTQCKSCDRPLCKDCERECQDSRCRKTKPFCYKCLREDDYYTLRCGRCDEMWGMH